MDLKALMDKDINRETIVIPEVTCPKCGGHIFAAEYAKDKMYVCWNKVMKEANGIKKEATCKTFISAYCKGCEKSYTSEDSFGKHGDVWECKECGRVCWPLTERKKTLGEIEEAVKTYLAEQKAKLARVSADIEAERRRYW